MKDFDFSEVVRFFGEQRILAGFLGIHPSNVSAWVRGFKIIPLHHAFSIERMSRGQFTAEMMRPDIYQREKDY